VKEQYKILTGDCREQLKNYEDNFFDCVVTDPPYGMKIDPTWDKDVPTKDYWEIINQKLKPGGYCLSFCSPRLYHRLATNIENAGFEIKDQIFWMVTTKMPRKNKLKQAHEPIVVAQKALEGTVEKNNKVWGVGKIDTESTRIPWDGEPPKGWVKGGYKRLAFGKKDKNTKGSGETEGKENANPAGRYPSNIIGTVAPEHQKYFYAPRASKKERGEYNDHPTPKPIDLMEYLIRIYTSENSIILDPFCGSGSTGIAALQINRKFVGIDLSEHYCKIAKTRIDERLNTSSSLMKKTKNRKKGRIVNDIPSQQGERAEDPKKTHAGVNKIVGSFV